MNVLVRIFNTNKYCDYSRKIEEITYQDIQSYEIKVIGEEELEKTGYKFVDDNNEYLFITLEDGTQDIFRFSNVDLYILDDHEIEFTKEDIANALQLNQSLYWDDYYDGWYYFVKITYDHKVVVDKDECFKAYDGYDIERFDAYASIPWWDEDEDDEEDKDDPDYDARRVDRIYREEEMDTPWFARVVDDLYSQAVRFFTDPEENPGRRVVFKAD